LMIDEAMGRNEGIEPVQAGERNCGCSLDSVVFFTQEPHRSERKRVEVTAQKEEIASVGMAGPVRREVYPELGRRSLSAVGRKILDFYLIQHTSPEYTTT